MQNCKWLKLNSSIPCNKSCKGEFCGQHSQQVRHGRLGPTPCIQCGTGVKGKTRLCAHCGGKKYRELKRYYDKKSKIDNIPALDFHEHDYITKFSDKLLIKQTIPVTV